MQRFTDSPFHGELDVVTTLATRAIESSIEDLRRHDELTIALRSMLKQGVSIDDLSEASGLSPAEIERRVQAELSIVSDIADLAGTR